MADSATRRVGRPSLAVQRQRQILAAFIELVGQRGLEHVSLSDVAAAAGVQQAALRHFIGNREELIAAAIADLVRHYELSVRTVLGEAPSPVVLVDTLFSDGWTRDNSAEDAAFDVLLAEGIRNPRTRGLIKGAYDILLDEIVSALSQQYPAAPVVRIRDTAYLIACLVEQNTTFQQLGYPRTRNVAAKALALRLVAELDAEFDA